MIKVGDTVKHLKGITVFGVLPMIVHKLNGEKAFCGIYESGKAIGKWFSIKNLEVVKN